MRFPAVPVQKKSGVTIEKDFHISAYVCHFEQNNGRMFANILWIWLGANSATMRPFRAVRESTFTEVPYRSMLRFTIVRILFRFSATAVYIVWMRGLARIFIGNNDSKSSNEIVSYIDELDVCVIIVVIVVVVVAL